VGFQTAVLIAFMFFSYNELTIMYVPAYRISDTSIIATFWSGELLPQIQGTTDAEIMARLDNVRVGTVKSAEIFYVNPYPVTACSLIPIADPFYSLLDPGYQTVWEFNSIETTSNGSSWVPQSLNDYWDLSTCKDTLRAKFQTMETFNLMFPHPVDSYGVMVVPA
jgi:hypothetical protein